jgi:hypothetical protein
MPGAGSLTPGGQIVAGDTPQPPGGMYTVTPPPEAIPNPTSQFAQIIWQFAVPAGGIVNTTTAVTMQAAGVAPLRNYLANLQISHDTLGAVTELAIRDGAGGTVLWRIKLQVAAVEQLYFAFPQPLQGTAATLIEVVTLTAVIGGVYVNAQGFQDN